MKDIKSRIDKANQALNKKASLDTPLQSHIVAEVENKPQSLRYLKPIDKMLSSVPSDLSDVGRETLLNLFKCFSQQGHVSEGCITAPFYVNPTTERSVVFSYDVVG